MKNHVICAAGLLALAGAANAWTVEPANLDRLWNHDGTAVNTSATGERVPDGTTYTVFTGLATTSNGLVLVESSSAPTFDDQVSWDGASESINNYLNIAGTGALGQGRTVVEQTLLGAGAGGNTLLRITVNSPGDLWPTGLAAGNPPAALVRGGFGIGLNLGAVLSNGPQDPLLWGTAATVPITAARLFIVDSGGDSGPISLPLATFFGGGNWNGVFGVVFSDTTSPTGVTGFNVTQIRLELETPKVPAPGAAGVLGLAGLVAARRRRA